MRSYWAGILRELQTLSPALRGRLIRHLITLLAGAGLIRGLTADEANAWQGLVELALSAVGFGLAIWLSQTSDAKQLAKATDQLSDAEVDAIVRGLIQGVPANVTGRPVPKYPTGEKNHNEPMNAEIAAREPDPTPAPPHPPNHVGVQ